MNGGLHGTGKRAGDDDIFGNFRVLYRVGCVGEPCKAQGASEGIAATELLLSFLGLFEDSREYDGVVAVR